MRRTLTACAMAAALLGGSTAAIAQAPCDSYSGGCPNPGGGGTGTTVKGTKTTRGGVTLPVSGGEVTLLLLAGTTAVAVGGSLVVASRRRHRAAA